MTSLAMELTRAAGAAFAAEGLDPAFGLVQASNHQIGSPVDQILLFCCQYNPTTGKYDLLISRVLFLAGAATIVILGGFLWFMFHFGGKKKDRSKTAVPVG